MIKEVGGVPVVIKLLEGTQGVGVILAETEGSAKSIIEAFSAANVNIMVQEFIREANGTDVRAFVDRRRGGGRDKAHRPRRASSAPTSIAAPPPMRVELTRRGAPHGHARGRRRRSQR